MIEDSPDARTLAAMTNIKLVIDDPANGLALKAMLEAEGHHVGTLPTEVGLYDDPLEAEKAAQHFPTLLVTAMSDLPSVVEAMKRGVHGYILLPLLPGEAGLMVERATRSVRNEAAKELTARTLDEVESEHILAVLRSCKHNRAKTARLLGIGRNTLWRKLKRMQVKDEAKDASGTAT